MTAVDSIESLCRVRDELLPAAFMVAKEYKHKHVEIDIQVDASGIYVKAYDLSLNKGRGFLISKEAIEDGSYRVEFATVVRKLADELAERRLESEKQPKGVE